MDEEQGVWWCRRCKAAVPADQLGGDGPTRRFHSAGGDAPCEFSWAYWVPEGCTNFWAMDQAERVAAFEILIESAMRLGYSGWDYLEAETLLDWSKDMHWRKRRDALQAIRQRHDYGDLRTVQELWGTGSQAVHIDLWRQFFQRLDPEAQAEYLEVQRRYYEQALPLVERAPYDWSGFDCPLERREEDSKLNHVRGGWIEYSVAVPIACKQQDNGQPCPCLRRGASTLHRCFKEYLAANGRNPEDGVPTSMLQK